jgi:hypothetical protein
MIRLTFYFHYRGGVFVVNTIETSAAGWAETHAGMQQDERPRWSARQTGGKRPRVLACCCMIPDEILKAPAGRENLPRLRRTLEELIDTVGELEAVNILAEAAGVRPARNAARKAK